MQAYSDAGVDAIGVWLHKLERDTMNEFWYPEQLLDREVVADAAATIAAGGLAVSHLVLAGRYTEPEPDVRARRIAHSISALEWAESLRCPCLVVAPGNLNGHSRSRALDITASALTEVLSRSEGSTVALAIEPIKEADFIRTLDHALDLVERIDHPRIGVYPDSFQLWRDPGLAEAIERAAHRVLGVHIADDGGDVTPTRLPPGEGVVPLVEFVRAVDRTGYDGTYDVELFTFSSSATETYSVLTRCITGITTVLAEALS